MTTYITKTVELTEETIANLPEEYILRNNKCPRCLSLHKALLFKKLTLINPPLYFCYWSMCPTTKEPILTSIIDKTSDYNEFTLSPIIFDKQ